MMDEKKVYNAITRIDDDLIEHSLNKMNNEKQNAEQNQPAPRRSAGYNKWILIPVCIAILTACSLLIIIPNLFKSPVDDPSQYAGLAADSNASIPYESEVTESTQSESGLLIEDSGEVFIDEPAAEEIPTEPPAWTHILMENYAVYKILEKTDETIQFPRWDGITWQKYGCEIVYMFPEEDYWREPQPGDVDETGLGFGEQHNDEIWIPETESAMISDGMYLLISPKKYHLNNKEYWMPDICDGKTEYLRFLDGKLSVPEGALDTGAFSHIKTVNAVGEDYKASSSEWVAILSQLRFSDGLSVGETTEYFEKVKEAFSALKPKP